MQSPPPFYDYIQKLIKNKEFLDYNPKTLFPLI